MGPGERWRAVTAELALWSIAYSTYTHSHIHGHIFFKQILFNITMEI